MLKHQIKPLFLIISRLFVLNSKSIRGPRLFSNSKSLKIAGNLTSRITFKLSTTSDETYFVFNHLKQPQLLKLQLEYRSNQNISIFQEPIKSSTGVLQQMNIFKIFKIMEQSTYNYEAYHEFFECVANNVKRKSDNIILLLASVKDRIAKQFLKQGLVDKALHQFQQALDILEGSMVPPLFPYYNIYRQFGLLHNSLGNTLRAKQILVESVQILDNFVSHSDDNVSSNSYCKNQASAYNVLAKIDVQNSDKWIQKANTIWQKFAQNKYNQVEYAKTVALNLQKDLKNDKQKGEAYYNFNLYKFQNKQFKEILKRAKQELKA